MTPKEQRLQDWQARIADDYGHGIEPGLPSF